MKISSFNEWDPLKEVIVGVPEAKTFLTFPDGNVPDAQTMEILREIGEKALPQSIVDEAGEDLERFCHAIETYGAKVHRPTARDVERLFRTPHWASTGNSIYNVRDLHLVVGNTVIESPSHMRHRYFESEGLRDIWYQYFDEGFRWIVAPKPRLIGNHIIPNVEENGVMYHKLTEEEILFEAANTVRMGRDLLYLVSLSGNYLGAKWLQEVLGPEYRVHTTEGIYRSAHLDSTVIALRPGLVLLNGDRVNEKNCPPIFDSWEKIYFHDIVGYPPHVIEFHRTVQKTYHEALNRYNVLNDLDDISSVWTGMNLFSLDPHTVVVDERQPALIKTLEQHKFTCIPLKMTNLYLMKGAFHCTTLDTVREGTLESYFD